MSSLDVRKDPVFRVGRWRVQPALNRLTGPDGEIGLEPKVMAVLAHLAARPGAVISADELIERIWHNRPMGDNPVYKCVAQLRKALGDDPQRPAYIATVPRKGYRLVAPVTVGDDDAAGGAPGRRNARPRRLIGAVAALTAISVLLGLTLLAGHDTGPPSPPADANVLAVLPFQEPGGRSGAISGGNLADGFSSQLATVPRLHVIAYNSSAALNSDGTDPRVAAARLNAHYIIAGELLPDQGDLSVALRLHGADGRIAWSRHYRRSNTDIQGLLAEMVADVTAHLGLAPAGPAVAGCTGTGSVEACQRYLLAQEHVRNRAAGYKLQALELLQQAIALDPGFALAHVSAATLYLLPGDEFPWTEARRMAMTAVARALELEPNLAEARAAQALALMVDERGPCPPACYRPAGYTEAATILHEVLEQSPGLALAHNWLAIALAGQGRITEAEGRMRIALSYDPLNPAINYNLALYAAYRGDPETARQRVREFMLRHPNPPLYMTAMLARVENYYGNFDASLDLARRIVEDTGDAHYLDLLIDAQLDLGLFRQAEARLDSCTECGLNQRQLTARHKLLIYQRRDATLADLDDTVMALAAEAFGEFPDWPRWLLRTLGRSQAVLGRHETAARLLRAAYPGDRPVIDHQFPEPELDGLHYLAFSLQALGDEASAATVLSTSLDLIRQRQDQGHTGFPDLTYAEARTYALQGNKALAVATLSRAMSQGWLRYWALVSDPRWAPLRTEIDFQTLAARAREDVLVMHNLAGGELVLLESEKRLN